MKMTAKNRIFLQLFLVFFLAGTVIYFQYEILSKNSLPIPDPECLTCNLKDTSHIISFADQDFDLYKYFFPADHDVIADYIWLKTTYFMGFKQKSDDIYLSLFILVRKISEYAPEWDLPYLYGAIVLLSDAKLKDQGFYILDKGMKNTPWLWELWLIKAHYLWKYEQDYVNAAQLLAAASRKPKAPKYLAALATTMAVKSKDSEFYNQLAKEVVKLLDDEKLIQRIYKKVKL